MEPLSDLDKLRFFRDEVKHEFSLLAMRSTILVTCQSFLVVPFAILQTVGRFRTVLMPICLIAVLGIFLALILRKPLNAAHRTIDKWLLNQRRLLKASKMLEDLTIDRDLLPGVDYDVQKDRDHVKSLAFSRFGPWSFTLFWITALLWSGARLIWGF